MKTAALVAITLYQRYVSPYKGYRCAYHYHTGCATCSRLGFRAIRRYGVWAGIGLLRERLERCGIAYRRYARAHLPQRMQRGFIDGCDIPCDGDCLSSIPCDGGCGDCGNWGGGDDKKKKTEEVSVHIPQARAVI